MYVGPDTISYINDEEKAFTNLVAIVEKMNLMQDPKFVSFPLGNIAFMSGVVVQSYFHVKPNSSWVEVYTITDLCKIKDIIKLFYIQ